VNERGDDVVLFIKKNKTTINNQTDYLFEKPESLGKWFAVIEDAVKTAANKILDPGEDLDKAEGIKSVTNSGGIMRRLLGG